MCQERDKARVLSRPGARLSGGWAISASWAIYPRAVFQERGSKKDWSKGALLEFSLKDRRLSGHTAESRPGAGLVPDNGCYRLYTAEKAHDTVSCRINILLGSRVSLWQPVVSRGGQGYGRGAADTTGSY